MEITPYFSDKRVFVLFCFLLNRTIAAFSSFSLGAHHQHKEGQSELSNKGLDLPFLEAFRQIWDRPPVEEALEGTLLLREFEMSDLSGSLPTLKFQDPWEGSSCNLNWKYVCQALGILEF